MSVVLRPSLMLKSVSAFLAVPGFEPCMNEKRVTEKLVDAQGLLNALFADECRPSVRWLRAQPKARAIPYFKFGRLVFFDVEMVRSHLITKRLVH